MGIIELHDYLVRLTQRWLDGYFTTQNYIECLERHFKSMRVIDCYRLGVAVGNEYVAFPELKYKLYQLLGEYAKKMQKSRNSHKASRIYAFISAMYSQICPW